MAPRKPWPNKPDYSIYNLPNPGMTKWRRRDATLAATLITALAASATITWPMEIMAIPGSFLMGGGIGAAVWLLIKVQKTERELAISEFRYLGVSDDLIDNVVLKARDGANQIVRMIEQVQDIEVGDKIDDICRRLFMMVNDFASDPGDIRGSRAIISRVVEQTPKIITNFATAEKGGKSPEFAVARKNTLEALDAIIAGLQQQKEKNQANNLISLDVDVQVTKDLFQQRTTA